MAVAQLANIQTILANTITAMEKRALHYENKKKMYPAPNEMTRKYDQYKKEALKNIAPLKEVLALTGRLMRELTPNIFSRNVLPPKVYAHYINYLEEARKYVAGCSYDMSRLAKAEKILAGVLHRVPDIKKLSSQKGMPTHL